MSVSSLSGLRNDVNLVKEMAERVNSVPRNLDSKETRDKLSDLVKTRKNHGDKLMKVGVAMIICPDPVSSVAGVPLVIAGKLMRSRESIGLKDVFNDLHLTVRLLSSFRLD